MSKNLATQRVTAPLPPKKSEVKKVVEEEVTQHQPVEDHLADETAGNGASDPHDSGDSSGSSDDDSESSDESSVDPQASRSRAWASRQAAQAESVMAAAATRLKQYLASKKPNEQAVGRAFIGLEDRASKLDSNYRPAATRGVGLMHAVADLHCRMSAIEQRKHTKRGRGSGKKSAPKKSASKKHKKEAEATATDGAATTAPVSPAAAVVVDEKMAEAVDALVA